MHAELRRALELNPERIEINVYVAGESPGQPEAISDAALVTGLPGSWIADRLGAGLAPYTVWRLHATLRAGLNRALKADPPILARNPASLVDPIQYELEEIDPLSALDARRVLQATQETPEHALYAVALGLGLREGELLGPRVEETAVKTAVRILDESLGGADFEIEIGPLRDGLEERKPDSVCDGHLSLVSCETSPAEGRGALYPGLGEQRRRPCLRLQQAGVTAFHPAPGGAGYVSVALSVRSLAGIGPGLRRAPCSTLSGLSSPPRGGAAVLPPGA